MPWFRLFFLVTVLAVTSGYRFRCYWFCIDQTGVQNDYVEERDRCREYAQLKLDMAMRESGAPMDDKTRKTQLVSLFSECMGNNGWTVPDGKNEKAAASAKPTGPGPTPQAPANGEVSAAAAPPAASAMADIATRQQEKAHLSRTAECDFARYAASTSSIAATRAQACDLECAGALKAAPGGPRPAACPSETAPNLANGYEHN